MTRFCQWFLTQGNIEGDAATEHHHMLADQGKLATQGVELPFSANGWPSRLMVPLLGSRKRGSRFTSVVFPAPEAPTRATFHRD
jgi:hypothetical protein